MAGSNTSPKMLKSSTPASRAASSICREEGSPERGVDVPDGVETEPVQPVVADPLRPQVDLALDDLGALREEVVEPVEVPVRVALAVEAGVAAVVVVAHVVEPLGPLDARVLLGDDGPVREAAVVRVQVGEVVRACDGRGIERLPVGVAVRLRRLFHVRGARPTDAAVGDHVARVVDDDVQDHLQAERMGALDEPPEVVAGAEVRVDAAEVDAPVAVVAGARSLHRALHDRRCDPDRRHAEPLHVRQPCRQAGQVAAVEVARVGWIEAGQPRGPGDAAAVVRSSPVCEAVGHHEVDALGGERAARRRSGQGGELLAHRCGCGLVARGSRHRGGNREHGESRCDDE